MKKFIGNWLLFIFIFPIILFLWIVRSIQLAHMLKDREDANKKPAENITKDVPV